MNRLTLFALVILVSLGTITGLAAAQNLPTAYIGDDVEGLTEALGKDPKNVGLRMRVVRRLLRVVEESSNLTENKRLLKLVSEQIESIYGLEPDFIYIYRVMALQHYRRRQYQEFIDVVAKYEKVADLDFEMRSMYVKNLLRMATDPDNPQPERKKEAAKYVGDWFDSGAAPLFSDTLGTTAAWLIDDDFRDELLAIFSDRYEKDPRNLNLVVSYAACLYAMGRNERAWKLVHEAERAGLCDSVTGGRHTLVNMLGWQAPEFKTEQSYGGSDLDELKALMERFPKNAHFPHRLALISKRKAVASRRVSAALLDKAIEFETKKTRPEVSKRLRERNAEGVARSKEHYREALAFAQKTLELNPTIDSLPLLLADIHANLDQKDKAIGYLRQSVEAVPFLTALRVKLAELYIDQGQWNEASQQLATVFRLVGCRADDWDSEPKDSLLPKPVDTRELLVLRIAKDAQGRKALTNALEAAIRAHPRNPNLKANLAMLHYFAGNKQGAISSMLAAEKDGMCGSDGFEHSLATYIYDRERW